MGSAVVLLNFGGPRDLDEVADFLCEILRDPNTLQLPLPAWLQDRLARRIARRRAPETARQYAEIGGRSPIVENTGRIAEALRTALAEAGCTVPVYTAHRYLRGHAESVAEEIVAAAGNGGAEGGEAEPAILAVPLYPHFSYATTGSSLRQLTAALSRAGYRGELRAMRSYPDAPGYLDALAERLEACLAAGAPPPEETVILCSAHGLPQAYVERGDPYRLELYRTVEGLRARFSRWRIELSFQSRVGPAQWLRPYTDRIIPEFAAEGVRHVVFVALSFVNDHIETLYEIDRTYFDLVREWGMTPHRAKAIEDHPGHIGTLAEAVVRWHAGRGGVPAAELLPPDQYHARYGRYIRAGWWAALAVVLFNALCG